MKNIIFIAPPAAGKGTMSELLIEKYGYIHISTGDILRGIAKSGTELGDKVAVIGRFIPNYWYSTANHKIWYDGAGFEELLGCFGFELLFGIACLSIGLVFTKFYGNRGEN